MGAWVGAEQAMVDEWVESALAAEAVALNAIDAGLSARVFANYAPPGTRYPFIIFQCQDPPRDVRGVGISRVMVDTLYVVKAVAQSTSYSPLAPVAAVIDRALTSPGGAAVGDGVVLTSVRERQFSLVEKEDGTEFRHFGGEYQIQAQG